MNVEQVIVTAIVAAAVTIGGSLLSRRLRLGQTVDAEKADLIATLKEKVSQAQASAAEAATRADAAERRAKAAEDKADATESRRQACEDEIARVKRDLRDTENELLDLYRRTGTRAPRSLTTRKRAHDQEERT